MQLTRLHDGIQMKVFLAHPAQVHSSDAPSETQNVIINIIDNNLQERR